MLQTEAYNAYPMSSDRLHWWIPNGRTKTKNVTTTSSQKSIKKSYCCYPIVKTWTCFFWTVLKVRITKSPCNLPGSKFCELWMSSIMFGVVNQTSENIWLIVTWKRKQSCYKVSLSRLDGDKLTFVPMAHKEGNATEWQTNATSSGWLGQVKDLFKLAGQCYLLFHRQAQAEMAKQWPEVTCEMIYSDSESWLSVASADTNLFFFFIFSNGKLQLGHLGPFVLLQLQ